MKLKGLVFVLVVVLSSFPAFCSETKKQAAPGTQQESDQQISEFSLAGYGEKGKKTWDLAGKSADIFDNIVKLKDVNGNLYGKEENINLTAQRGDFDKTNGKVHLEKDVVITTSGGTKLTTDSMDWDRTNQLVTTEDRVNIERQNMITHGTGAIGQMGLKQISLKKDVQVDILPTEKDAAAGSKEKTVITCDGALEVDYAKNIATFNDNVKVERPDSVIYSDKMEVFFTTQKADKETKEKKDIASASPMGSMGGKIDKIIASGNVRVVRGDNISYSDVATYSAVDKKLVLNGQAKLVIYSTGELSGAFAGN